MTHHKVMDYFKSLMPIYKGRIDIWFPNGKDSVRIRMKDRTEYVFSVVSENEWTFETVDSYIKKMKGATRMKC